MKAIFKREIDNYLNNPIGYVFLGIFILLFSGLFCYINLYVEASSEISLTFGYMVYAMLCIMPLLTMRLMAEEKASKTDQLLLTSPVSSTGIVLGKFFAVMGLVAMSLVFTVPHLAILKIFGNPAFGTTVLAYFGFLLYCAVYAAIGIYISSLTENQVISAVVSFTIFIGMLAIELLVVPAIKDPVLYKILGSISFATRFDDFYLGIFNISSVVYYLSIASLFIYLTVMSVEKRRW